jgi:flavodoxin
VKILICYHSQTGNTEKVAQAMHAALAEAGSTLSPVSEVNPSSLREYDLVLLGSGVYGGTVGASIKALIKKATDLPARFGLFTTHESTNPGMYKEAFKLVRKAIEKAGSIVCAEFDCLGENKTFSKERKQLMMASWLPENQEEREAIMNAVKGRPNKDDLENARQFAISLLNMP